MKINQELKKYIEEYIFPEYDKNEPYKSEIGFDKPESFDYENLTIDYIPNDFNNDLIVDL